MLSSQQCCHLESGFPSHWNDITADVLGSLVSLCCQLFAQCRCHCGSWQVERMGSPIHQFLEISLPSASCSASSLVRIPPYDANKRRGYLLLDFSFTARIGSFLALDFEAEPHQC